MNVDMLLSLSSDIQRNIKVVSSKSESDFLSVLDPKLDSESLENISNIESLEDISNEDEKVDEQLLQILSLLLININTNGKLDEKETTNIPIENEIKENSELQKLKDIVLSLPSDIKSNIKVVSNKSEADFLSVLDPKLDSESLGDISNEEEKVDEQLLQILSSLLTNINTNGKLDEKETTNIPIENEIKENSEVKKLKDIVLLLSSDIKSNIKVVSNKSEADFLSVVDKELAAIFKQDTYSKDLINELMAVKELYKTNKTENNNDNNINSLSNNITNIIENLYVNNEVENKEYINKLITEIINKNVSKENNEFTTLNTTKEILFEVNKFKNSITYSNKILESSSDELNILNSIAFSDNKNKNIQLLESTIRNKYELEVNTENYKELESNNIGNLNEQIKIIDDVTINASSKESNDINNIERYEFNNELDFVNIINVLSNSSNTKTEERNISQSVIRGEYITEDIVETVKYLKNNNFEELSIKMNPEELGEINIKLLKIEGEEKCVITLSEEDTFNLLKDNINEIKSHLSILDIKVKEISIEIRSENQNDFSDSLNQNSNKNNTKEEKKNKTKVVIEDIDNYLENNDTKINFLI